MDAVSSPEAVRQVAELAAQDFSLMALFLRADWVVKLVMLGLVAASVWSWAIIFEKFTSLRRLTARADAFEKLFWSGENVQKIYHNAGANPDHPMAQVFVAGMDEWVRASGGKDSKKKTALLPDAIQRIERILTITIAREVAALEKRMLFLATVGAVAPFVGLFGTVWGIMNSFQAIAMSRDTNLAVVAPGIAEALFATGLGLLAAIPAVIAYNKFTNDIGVYTGRLDMFADELSALFVHQIEESKP